MNLNKLSRQASHCTHGSLTSNYGWLFQCILASFAFACLVVKRFCEPIQERRSWLIWSFDTSKQAFGSLILHFINILTAELFAGTDPCTLYIISFLLDSSIGLLIVYIIIRILIYIAIKFNYRIFLFGDYGESQPLLKYWAWQTLAYILILLIQKTIITFILQWKAWDQVRDFILWSMPNQEFEIAFVVLIIPFVVNVFMFWVTDNFLMMSRTFKPNFSCSSHLVEKKLAILRNYINISTKLISMYDVKFVSNKQKLRNEEDDNLVEINLETLRNV